MSNTISPQESNLSMIPYDLVLPSFKRHISVTNNHRILFSGRFGSGKTTFLRSFFDDNDEYMPIYLYPVNYSVSSNEDIFELIKYDILVELLSNDNITIDKIEFSKLLTLQMLLISGDEELGKAFKKAGEETVKKLVEAIPVIGKSILDIGEIGYNLIKDIEGVHEEYHTKITSGEIDKMKIFEEAHQERKGGIYERDIITQLIVKFVNQLKDIDRESVDELGNSLGKKKIILIIDDLDRLDPDHIFRILNIFSAHVDSKLINSGDSSFNNKFNFDKILISCDIKNIRSVFATKFGQSTHFSGYIDKFYSTNIFSFSLASKAEVVSHFIFNNLGARNVPHKNPEQNNEVMLFKDAITGDYHNSINVLFIAMIKFDLISVRDIIKLSHKYFEFRNQTRDDDNSVTQIDQLGILFIDLLRIIYASDDEIQFSFEQADRLWNVNTNSISMTIIHCLVGNLAYLQRDEFNLNTGRGVYMNEGIIKYNSSIFKIEGLLNLGIEGRIDRKYLGGTISRTSSNNQIVRTAADKLLPNPFWLLAEIMKAYR